MDADTPRGPSAPYGHACRSCSQAKCRCISRGPGLSCERCNRLKRECQPSTVVRKRGRPLPSRSKTTQLEEKLNDIVALLKSSQTVQSGAEPEAGPAIAPRLPVQIEQQLTAAGPSYPSPSSVGHIVTPLLRDSHDQDCLDAFRTMNLKHLPFIQIPPETSAAEFQRDRPFLWLNIRLLTSKSVDERRRIDLEIRETLGRKMVVEMERNMDLLLGLIAYLSWYLDFDNGKKTLCLRMAMATSLIVDLCLDRRVGDAIDRETNSRNAYYGYWKNTEHTISRTNEERRAVLACYVTCTALSSFIRSPPMRWTPHMEECLDHLASSPETPDDEILATMVRLARIGEEVVTATSWRLPEPDLPRPSKLPPILLIGVLQRKLAKVRRDATPHVLQSKTAMGQMHFTEMIINDLPLYQVDSTGQFESHMTSIRAQCADLCLTAAQACLNAWFSLTTEEIYGATTTLHIRYARCTHIIYRLSIVRDPSWDRMAVRRTLNIIDVLDKSADRLGTVPGVVGLQSDGDDLWTRSAATMRFTVPVWTKVMADMDGEAADPSGACLADEVVGAAGGGRGWNDMVMMDFSDDWYTNVIMPELLFNTDGNVDL